MYLIRRPKGEINSETVPDKTIEALESTYGITLDDMLENILDCKNQKITDADRTSIYVGGNRYADCYFTIGYVQAGGPDYPLATANNKADLPDWVGDDDSWNGYRKDLCSVESAKDFPACKNL